MNWIQYVSQYLQFVSQAPGSYSPEKVNMEHQPAYSFGVKTEQKIKSVAPAPNQYSPEKPQFQPAYSFGGRHNHEKPSQTPGWSIELKKWK